MNNKALQDLDTFSAQSIEASMSDMQAAATAANQEINDLQMEIMSEVFSGDLRQVQSQLQQIRDIVLQQYSAAETEAQKLKQLAQQYYSAAGAGAGGGGSGGTGSSDGSASTGGTGGQWVDAWVPAGAPGATAGGTGGTWVTGWVPSSELNTEGGGPLGGTGGYDATGGVGVNGGYPSNGFGSGYGGSSSSLSSLMSMLPMMMMPAMMLPMMMMPAMMGANQQRQFGSQPGQVGPTGAEVAGHTSPDGGSQAVNAANKSTDGEAPGAEAASEPAAAVQPVGNSNEPPNTDVKLKNDHTVIHAPNAQVATAIQEAANNNADPKAAYAKAGITLPPAGTPIVNPIAPDDLQPGDVGAFKDHYVMALGDGQVLVNGQKQPASNVMQSTPDFLGWMRPTQQLSGQPVDGATALTSSTAPPSSGDARSDTP